MAVFAASVAAATCTPVTTCFYPSKASDGDTYHEDAGADRRTSTEDFAAQCSKDDDREKDRGEGDEKDHHIGIRQRASSLPPARRGGSIVSVRSLALGHAPGA
jgi:hypothetical protein